MGLENQPNLFVPSAEKRKSSKPLMEKKRRARINQSLGELKNLILEALKKDTSCYSKLEKADILEMTVNYLRSLKTQQSTTAMPPSTPEQDALAKYRAGFNECASEVSRYMMSLNGMNTQIRARMLSHLADHCNPSTDSAVQETATTQVFPQQLSPLPAFGNLNGSLLSSPVFRPSEPAVLNGATHFQLVPSQLANGKIATVLVPSQVSPATILQAAQQIVPVFKPRVSDFRALQSLQFPAQGLRADPDMLWRPW